MAGLVNTIGSRSIRPSRDPAYARKHAAPLCTSATHAGDAVLCFGRSGLLAVMALPGDSATGSLDDRARHPRFANACKAVARDVDEGTRGFSTPATPGARGRSTYRIAAARPGTLPAPSRTWAVDGLSASPIGSARPPKQEAKKFSVTALKAMLLTGRAKPCPSSGNTM